MSEAIDAGNAARAGSMGSKQAAPGNQIFWRSVYTFHCLIAFKSQSARNSILKVLSGKSSQRNTARCGPKRTTSSSNPGVRRAPRSHRSSDRSNQSGAVMCNPASPKTLSSHERAGSMLQSRSWVFGKNRHVGTGGRILPVASRRLSPTGRLALLRESFIGQFLNRFVLTHINRNMF